MCLLPISFFFFFNDTATTEIYTLSLHDALPICSSTTWTIRTSRFSASTGYAATTSAGAPSCGAGRVIARSEEHTSELQSRLHLVCRLLLEKKKKKNDSISTVRSFNHLIMLDCTY